MVLSVPVTWCQGRVVSGTETWDAQAANGGIVAATGAASGGAPDARWLDRIAAVPTSGAGEPPR